MQSPTYLQEFLTVAVVHLLAIASPGPDFAVVLKQSITHGKRSGIYTSIGIGVGVLVHISYCLLGLGLVIAHSIVAFSIIKICGAVYLIYIGLNCLWAKGGDAISLDHSLRPTPSPYQSFRLGFITNALNPKATLFFLSFFSLVLSPTTPWLMKAGYGAWMIGISILWFSALTVLLSHNVVREWFQRLGVWFDRVMGVVLVGLGVRLAFVSTK